jgi:hypothetical protein
MKRIGLALAALMIATGASAADYPTKPINFIVPFAAGGSNDIVARAIGKGLAEAWGQPVLIDNRAGAGGVIGAEAVARAPNDGHTILLVSSTFTINQAIRKRLPYDTLKDFSAVAFVAQSPLLVTAAPKLPASSVSSFIELAKTKTVTYASSGLGSINQIAAELIAGAAGIKLMHVPYRGGAPALNDLIGDHVDPLRVEPAPGAGDRAQRQGQSAGGDEFVALAKPTGRAHSGRGWPVRRRCRLLVGYRGPGGHAAAGELGGHETLLARRRRQGQSHDAGPVRRPDPQRNRALDHGRAPVWYFHRLIVLALSACVARRELAQIDEIID